MSSSTWWFWGDNESPVFALDLVEVIGVEHEGGNRDATVFLHTGATLMIHAAAGRALFQALKERENDNGQAI